jgi:hypothetical protein
LEKRRLKERTRFPWRRDDERSLHARRKEYSEIGFTGLLFLMAAFVAYDRQFMVP